MKLRNPSKSKSLFRRHLALFLITILIPSIFLLTLQIYRVSKDSMEQVEETSKGYMNRASRNLDMTLDQMNQITLQTSFNPDILELLKRPFDQSVYQYVQIKDLLRGWTQSSPLFHSLYLGVLQNRRVLTTNEGIYDMDTFYDKSIMEQIATSGPSTNSAWIGVRTVKTASDQRGTELLTFTRTIPATQLTPQGVLVINTRIDAFLKTLSTFNAEKAVPTLIFDPNFQPISPPIEGFNPDSIVHNLTPGMVYTDTIKLSGMKNMLFAEQLPSNGFTVLLLVPMEHYQQQVDKAIKQAAIILMIVIMAGTILSYFFASMMYDPWRRLAERMKGFTQKQGTESRDAYTFVNYAVQDLLVTVRKNEPLIRDRFVQELLHDSLPDGMEAASRLSEAGIQFMQPYFSVLVVSSEKMDAQEFTANRVLYLFSLMEENLNKVFPSIGTILDNSRFGYVLNIDQDEYDESTKKRIEDCCREVQVLAGQRLNAGLSFCLSGVYSLDKVHLAYEQVKRTMAYQALMPSDIYFTDRIGETTDFPFSALYQKHILNAILSEDRDSASGYVSELFDRYLVNNTYSYPKLLQMIMILMSHVIGSLAQEGFDITTLMQEVDLLQHQRCRNQQELRILILDQINCVINYLESSREKAAGYGSSIQQAIHYIQDHYATNISIVDIADSIGISASHLSRIFKAEVGKPPQVFLTEYRIKVSKDLLRKNNSSLNEIAETVGYNDVHNFIRSFKKVEGVTPGGYRKRFIDQI